MAPRSRENSQLKRETQFTELYEALREACTLSLVLLKILSPVAKVVWRPVLERILSKKKEKLEKLRGRCW